MKSQIFTLLALMITACAFSLCSFPKSGMAVRIRQLSAVGEGSLVPNVVFKARVRDHTMKGSNPFRWKDIETRSLFENKRVVLFSIPGGCMLTCSCFS